MRPQPARTAGSVTFAGTPRSSGARGATCKPERGSRPLRRSAAPSTAVPCTGTTAGRAGSDARPATRSTKESSGAGCEFRGGGRTTRCRCKLSRCLPVLRSTPTIAGGHRRSKDTFPGDPQPPFSRSALDKVARFVEHRPQANTGRELVNRSELCARIADRSSLSSADAASAVTAVISTITEALARGETVTIAGFGRFATKDRAARVARQSPQRRSPSRSPRPGCRPSRPARPFATRSTNSVAADVSVCAAVLTRMRARRSWRAPWHYPTVAIGARRCVGVGFSALPRRLRRVDAAIVHALVSGSQSPRRCLLSGLGRRLDTRHQDLCHRERIRAEFYRCRLRIHAL